MEGEKGGGGQEMGMCNSVNNRNKEKKQVLTIKNNNNSNPECAVMKAFLHILAFSN